MTLKNRFNQTIVPLLCVAMTLILESVSAQEYVPKPEYSFLDRNNVDVVGGKLTLTAPGVVIGSGDLGLEFKVSSYSGDFINAKANFSGASIYNVRKVHGPGYQFVRYIAVRSPAGEIRFALDENNQYVGLSNSQGNVVEAGDDFIVTYPDGTIATFYRTDDADLKDATQLNSAAAKSLQEAGGGHQQERVALLKELIYPSGYTITLHRINGVNSFSVSSVTTNTGLQLKHVRTETGDLTVYGINNANIYCSRSYTESCEYEGWPNARYQWSPEDATGLVFNNVASDLLFSVSDMAGLTTEYHHSPFDANAGADNSLYPLGQAYVWRITKIVQPSGRTTEYSYGNRTGGNIYTGRRVTERAVLGSVSTDTYTTNYSLGHGAANYAYTQATDYIKHTSGVYHGTELTYYTSMGVILNAADRHSNTTYTFNYEDWNNEITAVHSPQGTFKYYYDDNKHLTKRTHKLGADENASENIELIANYPTTCSNPKTCNKPTKVTDGEGNVTNFEYHSQSGQIAKITKPAGRNGIRPQTRYNYQQKYAWYKNSSGNLQQAAQPIWRLTQESTCQQGAASGNGCANSNDEVLTTYEYGQENEPNNLFLTATAITADGKTRRSCYENDDYGNRISETRPKGVDASCP